MCWQELLRDDPIPWLLEPNNPPVRFLTLRDMLGRPVDDPELVEAQADMMHYPPIRASLEAQYPAGYWVKPGPGYSPKYRATVWQIIFLEQMGADGRDPRIRRGCDYVLQHAQAESGGFGASGSRREAPPPASRVIHCLNGNLVRALLGLGLWGDERLLRAIEWQARAITGVAEIRYYRSGTCDAGFACAVNGGQPCAWGAIKALRGLSRVPCSEQSPVVKQAIQTGAEFLLEHDLVKADYPSGNGRVSALWFKLGFPSGYVADVLQNLNVLAELGYSNDQRLRPALEWLLAKQDARGRWRNERAYSGRLWADIERQGQPSKWVTWRALRVVKQARHLLESVE
jgi:hypothetical protein